jgi:hypothetical protein
MDDAIHILDDECNVPRTLCTQRATDLNVITITDEWPNPGDGCWTCLALARARALAPTQEPPS